MKPYITVTCFNIAHLCYIFIFVCSNIIYQNVITQTWSVLLVKRSDCSKLVQQILGWSLRTKNEHSEWTHCPLTPGVRSAHQAVTYHLARAGVFPRNSVPRAIPCNPRWERKEALWQSALYKLFVFKPPPMLTYLAYSVGTSCLHLMFFVFSYKWLKN